MNLLRKLATFARTRRTALGGAEPLPGTENAAVAMQCAALDAPVGSQTAGIPVGRVRGLPPLRAEAPATRSVPGLPDALAQNWNSILRPQAAYRWLLPSLAMITPQYVEMVLRGALAGNHVQMWELFDLMEDSWPELATCLQELKLGVQDLKMVFDPFADEETPASDTSRQKARLVSAAIRSMQPNAAADENALHGTIWDILDAWAKGIGVLEVDWQMGRTPRLGQFIGPRCTFWVHPICYAFSMEGKLGLRQQLPSGAYSHHAPPRPRGYTGPYTTTTFQPLPLEVDEFPEHRFLICLRKAKSGTALGGAMLRPLAWWWLASNFSADWCLKHAELFNIPWRIGKYDPNAPEAVKSAIWNFLWNMGSSGVLTVPLGTEVELVESKSTGGVGPADALLDRANKNCRLLILGQTLTGDTGGGGKGGGSLALGEVHEGVKAERIEAAGRFVCDVLNQQLIPSILRLNYGDSAEALDEAPTARMLHEEEGTLADAQRDAQLASSGLKIGTRYLRQKYGIPEPGAEEETIGGSVPAAPLPGNGNDTAEPPEEDDLTEKEEPNEIKTRRRGDAETRREELEESPAEASDARQLLTLALAARIEAAARPEKQALKKELRNSGKQIGSCPPGSLPESMSSSFNSQP